MLRENRWEFAVPRKSIAEELLLREYTDYRNTTEWHPASAKAVFERKGHYHWDIEYGKESKVRIGIGVLKGHFDDGNAHNYIPHLQVQTAEGIIFRIFILELADGP